MNEDAKAVCETMSVEEAARVLGIGRNLAYRLAGSGELPTLRVGRRFLVPRRALSEMLASAKPRQGQQ